MSPKPIERVDVDGTRLPSIVPSAAGRQSPVPGEPTNLEALDLTAKLLGQWLFRPSARERGRATSNNGEPSARALMF